MSLRPPASTGKARQPAVTEFDLTNRRQRYLARKAGHDVPKRKHGPKVPEFWSLVDRRAEAECWPWRGSIDRDGYGVRWHQGRTHHSHRVGYMLLNGPLPGHVVVRHKCDNPVCVNPSHLEAGTQAQNIADKMKRGRQAIGTRVHNAKLDTETVRHIRDVYRSGLGGELARQFGVTRGAIYRVVKQKNWRHAL